MSYADEMLSTSPAHGVAWARFLPRAIIALVLAAAGAVALEVLMVVGWYLVILAPAGAALAITGAVYMAVSGGHCRNRWLAVALGCLAGAVLYLGHYQVDMARQLGPQFALRVDLLPRYIVFRKQFVDQQKKLGPEAVTWPGGNAEKKVGRFGNWYLFAFEFGMSLFFPAWGGYFAAGRTAIAAEIDAVGRWRSSAPGMVPRSFARLRKTACNW